MLQKNKLNPSFHPLEGHKFIMFEDEAYEVFTKFKEEEENKSDEMARIYEQNRKIRREKKQLQNEMLNLKR